jgi:hypothetical protein
MTDIIDKLTAIKEHVEELMQGEYARAEKLKSVNLELALASALAALKAASGDCKHEVVRMQVNGARAQIQKALRAA